MSTTNSTNVDLSQEPPRRMSKLEADPLGRAAPNQGDAEPPLRVMALHALLVLRAAVLS